MDGLERTRITGIRVQMTVDGARFVHARLARDGAIERGSRGGREYSGRLADSTLYGDCLRKAGPDVLRWAGQDWSDPRPRGLPCELLIAFEEAGGREILTRWEYGTDSPEPPQELRRFLFEVVDATNAWVQSRLERRAVWQLVPQMEVSR
jgi:hypothetical protein